MASLWPVLPDVGSTIVPPARRRPARSPASIIRSPIRSLTLPPGFSISSLARIVGRTPEATRPSRTIGVLPTASRKVSSAIPAPFASPAPILRQPVPGRKASAEPEDAAGLAEEDPSVGGRSHPQDPRAAVQHDGLVVDVVPGGVQVVPVDPAGVEVAVEQVPLGRRAQPAAPTEGETGRSDHRVVPPLRLGRAGPALAGPRAPRGPAPSVVLALHDEVDLVVALGAVLGLPQPARIGIEPEPVGVAVAVGERPAPEGIAGRPASVLAHPEDLAERAPLPLRQGRPLGVAGDRVQHVVGAEVDHAAVVELARAELHELLPGQAARPPPEPDDAVPGPGDVHVHPPLSLAPGPAGVQGQPQRPLLAGSADAVDSPPTGVPAVLQVELVDLPREPLHIEEDLAVRCEVERGRPAPVAPEDPSLARGLGRLAPEGRHRDQGHRRRRQRYQSSHRRSRKIPVRSLKYTAPLRRRSMARTPLPCRWRTRSLRRSSRAALRSKARISRS